MAVETPYGPPQHADAPKGSRSRTWIALMVVFILIGAILGFLVWRNQPANPVGFEKGRLRCEVDPTSRRDGPLVELTSDAVRRTR